MQISFGSRLACALVVLFGLLPLFAAAQSVKSLSVTPTGGIGGDNFSGQVTLTSAAPSAGLPVAFSSSSKSVALAGKIVVAAGSMSATFSMTSSAVAVDTVVKVTVTANKTSATAQIALQAPFLAEVSITPNAVFGPTPSTGLVSLSSLAPVGGLKLTLKSNSPYAVVPSSVVVGADTTAATFPITTSRVPQMEVATISATLGTRTMTSVLTMFPISDLAASPWPKFRQYALNQAEGSGKGAKGTLSWTYRLGVGAAPTTPLAVSHDDIVCYGSNGVVWAVKGTGTVLWSLQAPGGMQGGVVVGPTDVVYYVAQNGTTVVAISPTGTKLWSNTLPGPVSGLGAGPNGVVCASTGKTIYVIADDGSTQATLTQKVTVANLAVSGSSLIYFTGSDDSVNQMTLTGTIQWSQKLGDIFGTGNVGVPESLVIRHDGSVLVPIYVWDGHEHDFDLFALDIDGKTSWSQVVVTGQPKSDHALMGPLSVSPDDSIVLTQSTGGDAALQTEELNADGSMKWKAAIGSGSFIGSDDNVYAYAKPTGSLSCYAAANGALLWTSLFTGAAAPSARGDELYVAADHVYALDSNGVAQWMYGGVESSPTLGADGSVYIGTDGGQLLALTSAGSLKWTFKTGGAITGSPAVDASGLIYVGSADGDLYAVDATGKKKWACRIGSAMTASPAIGFDGAIYIGAANGNFYAVNPNGSIRWTFAAGSPIVSSAALDALGTLYFGTHGGTLYALDPSRNVLMKLAIGVALDSSPAVVQAGYPVVYIGGGDGALYAVQKGAVTWTFKTGGSIPSSPAVGPNGRVYFGSTDGNVYCLTSAGVQKWSIVTGGPITSSPSIGADGAIYVGSSDHYVYAIYTAGHLLWKFPTRAAVASSPTIGNDGTIYVGSSDGNVYAIK